MDLDDFIIAVFYVVDEAVPVISEVRRLRQRELEPTLAGSEVLTMEVVSEYLGLPQDSALFAYFRRHYAHFLLSLRTLHRSAFVHQAVNLWWVKERLWRLVATQAPHDEQVALIESFALPVCLLARTHRCRRFRGEAAYGKDTLTRQTFYGFRIHVRLCWPGVITRVALAPANVSELAMVPDLAAQTTGWLVGDRNYWKPILAAHAQSGLALLAPFRWSVVGAIASTVSSANSLTVVRSNAPGPAMPEICESPAVQCAHAYARSPAQVPAEQSAAPTGAARRLEKSTHRVN